MPTTIRSTSLFYVNFYTLAKRYFHISSARLANEAQNHYKILNLPYDASPADIKRQFYALSKQHHPDLNPHDPTASSRFHVLSEAYKTLSNPSSRSTYDKTLNLTSRRSRQQQHPGGSYHSSQAHKSGPAGGRPPTGLSRRRSQFRGPPPSFYQQGAWGVHGAKRAAAAEQGRSEQAATDKSSSTKKKKSSAVGMEEDYASTQDEEAPHWDRMGHFRTQEGIRQRAEDRRSREREESDRGSRIDAGLVVRFVAVSSVVLLALTGLTIPGLARTGETGKARRKGDG